MTTSPSRMSPMSSTLRMLPAWIKSVSLLPKSRLAANSLVWGGCPHPPGGATLRSSASHVHLPGRGNPGLRTHLSIVLSYAAGNWDRFLRGRKTFMKVSLRIVVLLAVAALALSTAGCDKLRARDQLNKGVASYKNARYEQAIEHFKNAVALDPALLNAKLYLAAAYVAQYIPGVDSPDNLANANGAIDQYKAVLAQDPKNVNSIKGIAGLSLQMKKFDDARSYYKKAIDLDQNDPEAYYSIGVIDWTMAFQPRMEERAKLGLRPDEPLKDKKVCAKLRDAAAPIIQDGIDNLN